MIYGAKKYFSTYDLVVKMIGKNTTVLVNIDVLSINRCTLGYMFYELCDEVNDFDWDFAFQQLIEFLEDVHQKVIQIYKK